jgi:hypothetical protein
MRPQLSRILCSTLLFVVVGSFGSATVKSQPAGARGGALGPGLKISCSLHTKPGEPFDPQATSALPGNGKFVAREHFKEDVSSMAEVRISWLGATFMRRFAVKIEDDPGDATLRTYALNRPSSDIEITAELDVNHETRLADLWCLLKLQPNGEDGPLQTNAVPNIFFVRDAAGVLGTVDVIWAGAGWEVGASPAEGQRQWSSGSRVISH